MSTLRVTITSPDGKNQTTLSIPGTSTIKQLLQQACVKLKLTDTVDSSECDRYTLRHNRTTLDLSNQVRLSGLSAGAKLDIIPSFQRGGMVSVALQYTGNHLKGIGRYTADFPSNTNLWTMLAHLEASSGGKLVLLLLGESEKLLAPQLVILGQEFNGLERLVKTTLSGIGLNNGNCLIRMCHKPCEVSTLPDAISIVSMAIPLVSSDTLPVAAPRSTSPVQNPVITSPEPSFPVVPQIGADRKIILYTPPSQRNLPTIPDLPESHYELGETEFRLHLATAHARTRALMEAPLISRTKLIERQQADLLLKHPTTRIRFRFPDQFLLEATFQSIEPATNLFDFIRHSMIDPSLLTTIHLSVGPPPKPIINDGNQLWKLDLIPAAIINVSFDTKQNTEACLKDSIVQTRIPLPRDQSMDGPLYPENGPLHPEDDPLYPENGPLHPEDDPLYPEDSSNPTLPQSHGVKKPSWLRLGK